MVPVRKWEWEGMESTVYSIGPAAVKASSSICADEKETEVFVGHQSSVSVYESLG